MTDEANETRTEVKIPSRPALRGELVIPRERPRGIVLVAGHGLVRAGSELTQTVASELRKRANVATLVFDLLAEEEGGKDGDTNVLRNHLPILAQRLNAATDYALTSPATRYLPIGYYAGGMGTAAALHTASGRQEVKAVVSRSGRPDLAGGSLDQVRAPTLLVVGESDALVLGLNRSARARLRGPNELAVLPTAGEDFASAEAREELVRRASDWFTKYLG